MEPIPSTAVSQGAEAIPVALIPSVPSVPEAATSTKTVLPERDASLVPALRAHVNALVDGGLRGDEGGFVTDATLARYLRARGHDVVAAAAMLARSVGFRRERGAVAACSHCAAQPPAHSFYPIGPAAAAACACAGASPVTYSNFAIAKRDPASSTEHMMFAMEALFDDRDTSQMIWVMDFHGFSRADISPANARATLTLFADHYPERLGRAVIYGAPYVFYGLWAAVKLFAAPETVRKVVFIKHDPAAREKRFQELGIRGQTLERLCREIDEARVPAIAAQKNWWEIEPLHPVPHYGRKIMQARRKLESIPASPLV